MRRSAKIRILALAALVVMAFAAALASFSFAGKDDLDSDVEYLADAATAQFTNVDYIVKNSVSATSTDKFYHIVEIGTLPGTYNSETDKYEASTPTSLGKMVTSEAFRNFVLNGNKSADVSETMPEKMVDYQYFCVASVKDDSTEELKRISKADFVYIRNDDAYHPTNGNDLCEELYNLLHTYALGDYKPLVIDSPSVSGSTVDITESKNLQSLFTEYYGPSGYLYYTYSHMKGTLTNVDDFLSGVSKGSKFIGINGRKAIEGWTSVKDSSGYKRMSKMLVISGNETAIPDTDSTFNYLFAETTQLTPDNDFTIAVTQQKLDDEGNPVLNAQGSPETETVYKKPGELTPAVDITNIYKIEDTPLAKKGYNSRYTSEYHPEYVEVTTINIADLTADTDISSYDMIMFEASCGNPTVDNAVFNNLAGAMYGGKHIIYDPALGTASSTGGGTLDDPGKRNDTNYRELFYMVANDQEEAREVNIMVTSGAQFGVITQSTSSASAKVIADLINAASYRGIGGPGASGNVFTVLEIQPYYPIDLQLAEKNKSYYNKPADIVNNKTAEQLGFDRNNKDADGNIIVTGNETEYYAWELSEAKIADALGMDASKVEVVHMSTEELECYKAGILGNFDMVYIGGNTSPKKKPTELGGLKMFGWGKLGDLSDPERRKYPTYNMYAHNGDVIALNFANLGQAGNKLEGSVPFGRAVGDPQGGLTFTSLSGNDLSYSNMIDLKAFVDAGLPVIFSANAKRGYDEVAKNGYLQNEIDPDSNMYEFMKYCYVTHENDEWIQTINETHTEFVPADDALGATQTGLAEVFIGSGETDPQSNEPAVLLKKAYDAGAIRPKLAVTKMPAIYNAYDASTKLPATTKSLDFEYNVNGDISGYKANLYIDDNNNAKFEADEKVTSSQTPGKLSWKVDRGGPISWQLEIEATSRGHKTLACSTGISYIVDPTKKKVTVLQIYGSAEHPNSNVIGAQGNMSLFFCTECQSDFYPLYWNTCRTFDDRDKDENWYASGDVARPEMEYWTDQGTTVYLGRHEHTFGVVKYESGYERLKSDNTIVRSGRDDWDENLADEISSQYTFDIDIMDNREFDQMAQDLDDYFAGLTYEGVVGYDNMSEDQKTAVLEIEAGKLAVAQGELDAMLNGTPDVTEDDGIKESEYQKTEAALRDYIENTMLKRNNLDAYAKKEFQRLLDTRRYHEFFGIWGSTSYHGGGHKDTTYEKLYEAFARQKTAMLDKKDEVRLLTMRANYEDWLGSYYSCVILGPQENFNNEDITNDSALRQIRKFILDGKTLLLFHETLGRFTDAGPAKLTAAIYDVVGNNPDRMLLDKDNSGDVYKAYKPDPEYARAALPVKDTTNTAREKYFLTNLSYKNDGTQYKNFETDFSGVQFNSYYPVQGKYMYAPNIYSSTPFMDTSAGTISDLNHPYKYANITWSQSAKWANSGGDNDASKSGTNRASQNNKGVITTYPFTLSSELNITGTHPSAYALEVENDDLTCWYSLAGGTIKPRINSELYAANPKDGKDNYFIYSFKNVYYCGAGHTKVTGQNKDNNDERRLYINVICQSVADTFKRPSLNVYDYESNPGTNNVIKPVDDGASYEYPVEETVLYPNFTYQAIEPEATITKVEIYYKLNDLDSDLAFKTGDRMIATLTDKEKIKSGNMVDIGVNSFTDADGNLNIRCIDAKDPTKIGLLIKKDNGYTDWSYKVPGSGAELFVHFEEGKGLPLDSNGRVVGTPKSIVHPTLVGTSADTFMLRDSDFQGLTGKYGGNYTYIVIAVYTDKGGNVPTYKKIKVILKPHLFDLT